MFLGEHSNVNNVINGPLCLCSWFYVQVFAVNNFWEFPEFFFGDRGVGGVYLIQTFLDFYIFLYLQGPLASVPPYNQDSISCTLRPSSREGGGNSMQLSTREALNVQPRREAR